MLLADVLRVSQGVHELMNAVAEGVGGWWWLHLTWTGRGLEGDT